MQFWNNQQRGRCASWKMKMKLEIVIKTGFALTPWYFKDGYFRNFKTLLIVNCFENNFHFWLNIYFYLSKPPSFVHRICYDLVFVTQFDCPIGSRSKQISSKVLKILKKTILFCKAILLANVFKIPLNFVRKGSFDGTFRVILKSVYSSYIARCVFRVPQKIKITQDWFYVVKWSRNIPIVRKKVGFGRWL